MDNEKGPFTWIKKIISKDGQSDKKPGKFHYLLLVLLFGAAIMLISNTLFQEDSSTEDLSVFKNGEEAKQKEEVPVFGQQKSGGNDTISNYEKAYEAQIKEALDAIVGVEDATVVVNVDATEKKVLEKIKRPKHRKPMKLIGKAAKGRLRISHRKNSL